MESATSASTRRVLIVDDEPALRETLAEILSDEGYQVSTAQNGMEALLRLERDPLPCVILLDLMMPVMDGWSFRARQARLPRLAGVPVCVFSAADDLGREAESLSASGFLPKPVSVPELLNTLKRYCN